MKLQTPDMKPTDDTSNIPPVYLQKRANRFRLTKITPWFLVVGLVISNGMTLLNDRVHALAYGAIVSIAQMIGEDTAHSILSRSPEQVRAKAVDRATHDLKVQNTKLLSEHESLRKISDKRAATVKKLTKRASAKLAARSAEAVTSLPIRAVPYAGIAALVAFTGWEIKSDCEVATSLNELAIEHEVEPIDTNDVCKYVDMVPSEEQAWAIVKSQASTTVNKAYDMLERYLPSHSAANKSITKGMF